MKDLIERQEAIDAVSDCGICIQRIVDLPSAQPEITLESAIDYLHSIGWMQEHDRVLTESAQPVTGELIRRQDAIEELARRDTTDGYVKVFSGHEVCDILFALPSAQPERKTGRWIDDGDPFMWFCDVCGYRVKRYNNTRYCPHCGAKMEVDDGSY